MYKCQKCEAQVEAGEKPCRIIPVIRKVKYTTFKDKGNQNLAIMKTAYGKEIVSEKLVCKKCEQKFSGRPKISPETKEVDIYI